MHPRAPRSPRAPRCPSMLDARCSMLGCSHPRCRVSSRRRCRVSPRPCCLARPSHVRATSAPRPVPPARSLPPRNPRPVDNSRGRNAHRLPSAIMHPFQVMAEPVRRRIVDILASGEHTSGELADVIGTEFSISSTAVSKHLRRMLDAGFLDVRADWSNRVYRLSDEAITLLEAEVADLRRKFDERIGGSESVDPTKAGVAPKGVGRPGRRGGRGKGFAGDPWRAWVNPTPFGMVERTVDRPAQTVPPPPPPPPPPPSPPPPPAASRRATESLGERRVERAGDAAGTWELLDELQRESDAH
jgi:DNA-binding transcriptional ArsR family regulator